MNIKACLKPLPAVFAFMIVLSPCPQQSYADDALRVATINVWSGLNYKGSFKMGYHDTLEIREKRYNALLNEIRRLKPDVININEANYLPGYVKRLAKDLDYSYIYHVGVSGIKIFRAGLPVNLREGDAILARKDLNLVRAGYKQLSGGPVFNCMSFHTTDATQVIIGKINISGKEVYIANTHLHASVPENEWTLDIARKIKERWNYSEADYSNFLEQIKTENRIRANEMVVMIDYLKRELPRNAFLILSGDFNAPPDSPEIKALMDSGFYDTYSLKNTDEGYTWDSGFNDNIKIFYKENSNTKQKTLYEHLNNYLSPLERKRIDFIFASSEIPGNCIVSSQLCFNKAFDGVMPSDHFGVMTSFDFESKENRQ